FLRLKDLGDTSLQGNGVLMINKNGKVVNGGSALDVFYDFPQRPADINCEFIPNANLPQWERAPQQMYLIPNKCLPDSKLGIGVKPTAKLHVFNTNATTLPLLIERKIGSQPNYKLLQLDNNGVLSAREVKVDLTAWPDYVFKKDYELMPLKQVDDFIQTNGHLPNVPKAETIETEGLNLGEMNKLLMQKVEELTLYLIEQQKLIEAQQKRIEALENQNK
ncbi:MAG TPA: hypothetical protein PLP27_09980, partial [Crocinitomicaceae bacterium]|nr:hypothetical protein [Crocinitomicaceae bacterium]